MNLSSIGIWLLCNFIFGALAASILFLWVACNMEIPMIFLYILPEKISSSIVFDVPYTQLDTSILEKILFNAFLYFVFGFLHTFFAQESIQKFLCRWMFPKQTMRTVYCMIVTTTVFFMMGLWQQTNIQLWNLLPPGMNRFDEHVILSTFFIFVSLPGWYVLIKFDPLEFFGVKQIFHGDTSCPLNSLNKRTTGTGGLVTSGLFRLCRHPLYLFMILGWLLTPKASLDRFLIIFYTMIYLLFAIPIEERKLINIFGEDYVNYQQKVPAVIPFFKMKNIKKSKKQF